MSTSQCNNVNMFVAYIGRAVFASCPHELERCTENETLSVPANGGSAIFNATVTYIRGGNCSYLQNIKFVKLRKKLNETTGQFEPLFICKFIDSGYCGPIGSGENLKLNFSRGRSGFEYIVTLFNVTDDNIGIYEVIVEKSHPSSGGVEHLTKIFHLYVGK